MRTLLVAIPTLLLVSCADESGDMVSDSATQSATDPSTVVALAPSGSGYPDLEGSVINYSYNDWSGFQFAIYDNKVKWHGFEGYFLGVTREVVPQISRVGNDIYFSSWQTSGNGGDNVVHNFNTMEVNAHLHPDQSAPETMEMITGVVHCRDTPDCIFPSEAITPDEQVFPIIRKNMTEQELPPLGNVELNNTLRHEADRMAREDLAGMAIVLDTPDGTTRIEVDGAQTHIRENDGAAQSHLTYATKISDEIYFISWLGAPGGNHVVINREWMKAFDHISPTGERAEMVYDVSCFDAAEDCQ